MLYHEIDDARQAVYKGGRRDLLDGTRLDESPGVSMSIFPCAGLYRCGAGLAPCAAQQFPWFHNKVRNDNPNLSKEGDVVR